MGNVFSYLLSKPVDSQDKADSQPKKRVRTNSQLHECSQPNCLKCFQQETLLENEIITKSSPNELYLAALNQTSLGEEDSDVIANKMFEEAIASYQNLINIYNSQKNTKKRKFDDSGAENSDSSTVTVTPENTNNLVSMGTQIKTVLEYASCLISAAEHTKYQEYASMAVEILDNYIDKANTSSQNEHLSLLPSFLPRLQIAKLKGLLFYNVIDSKYLADPNEIEDDVSDDETSEPEHIDETEENQEPQNEISQLSNILENWKKQSFFKHPDFIESCINSTVQTLPIIEEFVDKKGSDYSTVIDELVGFTESILKYSKFEYSSQKECRIKLCEFSASLSSYWINKLGELGHVSDEELLWRLKLVFCKSGISVFEGADDTSIQGLLKGYLYESEKVLKTMTTENNEEKADLLVLLAQVKLLLITSGLVNTDEEVMEVADNAATLLKEASELKPSDESIKAQLNDLQVE
ncbi:hypothetical protein BB559_002777 [Furculomyces boomerangus]|uniref:Enhancer of translation termination 1 n=2 Tax=Harpellales TaxID=61421 RepID=A0A2T9YSI6_9FUNG|nr:hypothetical protein BB559_005365 [Furculomyces boomerangus]PVU95308.1 hypothetical protein BB559_002777 [Furculomyces boomerangus]PVZ98584.1 hypothetical protein BB558_005413 [Smittium angustum]